MDDEMLKALQADREKLRQLTGEDHGPFTLCEDGTFCSDQWCLRLGCALARTDGEHMEEKDGQGT